MVQVGVKFLGGVDFNGDVRRSLIGIWARSSELRVYCKRIVAYPRGQRVPHGQGDIITRAVTVHPVS